MKHLSLFVSLCAVLFAGCAKEEARPQSAEKEILSFQVNGVNGSIYDEVKTVNLILPAGTDASALSPVITVSDKATVTPLSGTVQDFSAPVHYTVTAEDGTQQAYIVGAVTLPEDAVRTRGPDDVYVQVFAVGGGAASGGGYYPKGSSVVLWAFPHPAHKFDNWVASPGGSSQNNPYWIYPTQDTWVTAYFSPIFRYTVTVVSEDTGKGTVSGGGTVTQGQSVSISATPAAGYVFDGWYKNGIKLSGLGAHAIYRPTETCTLVAKFDPIPPVVSGPGVLCVGSSATFTVANAPAAGFTWDNSSNLSLAGSGSSVTVTGTGNGAGWVRILVNSSEVARCDVWVGSPPAISQFLMEGPCFNYGYTTTYLSVCPNEPITLYPEIPDGVGSILDYEVQSTGCFATVSSLTGAIQFTGPSTVRAIFSISFRYRNSCGWSSWQMLFGSVRDCAAGEEPF